MPVSLGGVEVDLHVDTPRPHRFGTVTMDVTSVLPDGGRWHVDAVAEPDRDPTVPDCTCGQAAPHPAYGMLGDERLDAGTVNICPTCQPTLYE